MGEAFPLRKRHLHAMHKRWLSAQLTQSRITRTKALLPPKRAGKTSMRSTRLVKPAVNMQTRQRMHGVAFSRRSLRPPANPEHKKLERAIHNYVCTNYQKLLLIDNFYRI